MNTNRTDLYEDLPAEVKKKILARLLKNLEEVREMAMPTNLPCGEDDAWIEAREQRIAELEAEIRLAQGTL
jgi:hypothetical protein